MTKIIESAFWHAFDHIKLCADNRAILNRKKFKLARETVEFAAFDATIAAIGDFPTQSSCLCLHSEQINAALQSLTPKETTIFLARST